MKKFICPLLLTGLFFLLILLSVPSGCVYGSATDWLSQHAALAETIRDACLEQKTLLPDFLALGGGSSGFQFSYYGYLRPDILLGCLLPAVPMYQIVILYSLAGYLAGVLLFYLWLRREQLSETNAFLGSLLFLTASCFFHTHRQIMFVNYMPFLLLALLSIQKRPRRMPAMLPVFLLLICLNSFYYAPACFLAAGWYWLQKSGRSFFLPWFAASALAACMSAALLLPTGLAILEHHRPSASAGSGLLTFFENFSSLLYSPYGLGLTMLALYLLLLGLGYKQYRRDSLIFLLLLFWGGASYLLNATLYARAKILMPFLPLLLLHGTRLLADLRAGKAGWKLWPFLPVLAVGSLYLKRSLRSLVLADILVLAAAVLVFRFLKEKEKSGLRGFCFRAALPLLFVMPFLSFLHAASTEHFVTREELASAMEDPAYTPVSTPFYRQDSLINPMNRSNTDITGGQNKSTMYSSVYNNAYSRAYYDLLKTPIQINNRLAILAADNPFFLHFMGIRYVETKASRIPDGYRLLWKNENLAVSENDQVLPMVYFTDRTMPQAQFESLAGWEQAEALTRYSVIPDGQETEWLSRLQTFSPSWIAKRIPASVQFTRAGDSGNTAADAAASKAPDSKGTVSEGAGNLEITASKDSQAELIFQKPLKDKLLLLDFQVENHTGKPVIITINGVKNKLSASSAPYPNGNSHFYYAFSSEDKELRALELSLSKGRYTLKNVRFLLLDTSVFSEKSWTPARPIKTGSGEIFACRVKAGSDGWLVTSIPLQNGMSFFVDGRKVRPAAVNTAFAGTPLSAGDHEIRLCFQAPGKRAGILLSLCGAAGWAAACLCGSVSSVRRRKRAE